MAQATTEPTSQNKLPFIPANVRKPAPHPAAAHVPPDLDNAPVDRAAGQPTQPVQPTPPTQPVQSTQPPQATLPTQATPSVAPTAPVTQPPVAQPPMAPQEVAPVMPSWNIADWQRQQQVMHTQQLEQQRQQYAQQLAEREQALTQAQQRLAELERERAQQALNAQVAELTAIDVGQLDYLDDAAYRELKEKVLTPLVQRTLQATEARIAQAQAEAKAAATSSTSAVEAWRKEQQQAQLAQVNSAITARHPDIEQLITTPEYSAFMAQVIPGTLVTRGSQVVEAYKAGNAEYVNQMIDAFKSQTPTLTQFATQPVNPVASAPAAPNAGQTYKYSDLSDAMHRLNRREITPEQYAEFLTAFSEAEASGRVVG